MPKPSEPSSTECPGTCDAVIIGAGLTGLAIAHRLSSRGLQVKVLEKTGRIGGAIRSSRKDGYLCEEGPNSMLIKSAEVMDFLHSLAMENRVVMANALARKRFLVRRGQLLPMPDSPLAAVRTTLYSWPAKLRLLAEPFIRRSSMDDESVARFVRRRMGWEFLDYGIAALVSGIFAGDPQRLSIRHAFPKVWQLEQRFGSLIGGAVRLKRERRRKGIQPFKSQMLSFRDGLGELPAALHDSGKFEVLTNCNVESISRDNSWKVSAGGQIFAARHLILACQLDALACLPCQPALQRALKALPPVEHPPLATLVLGFDRSQISHPLDGFGALFPLREQRFCLGAIFSSTLFPERSPTGKVSLMVFIGGRTQPDHAIVPLPDMIERATADLRPLLGIKGYPEFHHHTFWPRAIPQYDMGHQNLLDGLEAIEGAFPGLHIQGNFRGGPGLNDRLQQALDFNLEPAG